MKLLDIIGIHPTKGELITIAAKTGQGRTSLLCKVACDFVNQGKKVLFITDENNIRILESKCDKILVNRKGVFTMVNTDYPVETIIDYSKETSYDVVILDGYFGNKTNFRVLAQNHDTLIINTIQMKRDGNLPEPRAMQTADCIISITRVNASLTLMDKVKNFLIFWKPKKVAPNAQIAMIKNRYGKSKTTDVNFDFGELTVKKV